MKSSILFIIPENHGQYYKNFLSDLVLENEMYFLEIGSKNKLDDLFKKYELDNNKFNNYAFNRDNPLNENSLNENGFDNTILDDNVLNQNSLYNNNALDNNALNENSLKRAYDKYCLDIAVNLYYKLNNNQKFQNCNLVFVDTIVKESVEMLFDFFLKIKQFMK